MFFHYTAQIRALSRLPEGHFREFAAAQPAPFRKTPFQGFPANRIAFPLTGYAVPPAVLMDSVFFIQRFPVPPAFYRAPHAVHIAFFQQNSNQTA